MNSEHFISVHDFYGQNVIVLVSCNFIYILTLWCQEVSNSQAIGLLF